MRLRGRLLFGHLRPGSLLDVFGICLGVITGISLTVLPALPADCPPASLVESVLPIDMQVPFVAPAFPGGDSLHLAYELHLSCIRPVDLRLEKGEVFVPGEPERVLCSLADSMLARHLWNPGQKGDSAGVTLLRGGLRVAVFIWLTVPDSAALPAILAHRVTCIPPGASDDRRRVVEGACIDVPEATQLLLRPPLRPGLWFCGNGPSPSGEHRSFLMAIDGQVCNSQRFASDWILLGADGHAGAGDLNQNSGWYAYGAEVLAAADGVIREIKDGLPENVPLVEERAVANTRETIGGNYVFQEVGDRAFIFYAHLMPGSIRVQEGERVKAGQVLGSLGNSGNSDAPHLHFHVCDGPDPLASEGIPFLFTEFSRVRDVAKAETDGVFLKGQAFSVSSGSPPARRTGELPLGENLLIQIF